MENLEFVNCATISRLKNNNNAKKGLIRPNYLPAVHILENTNQMLPAAQPWRVISSKVVARQLNVGDIAFKETPDLVSTKQVSDVENKELENFVGRLKKDVLRTPLKRIKQKAVDKPNKTKNCELLFTKFSNHPNPPSRCPISQANPSYSVQRIVQGSGLLNVNVVSAPHSYSLQDDEDTRTVPEIENHATHGSEASPEPEEMYENSSNASWNSFGSKNGNCFDKNEIVNLDNDPIPLYSLYNSYSPSSFGRNNQDLETSLVISPSSPEQFSNVATNAASSPLAQVEKENTGSFFYHPSQSPLFDAIVFQKTVETEVVEYNYSDAETSSTAKSARKTRRSRNRARKRNSQRSKRIKMRELQSGYDPSPETDASE